MWAREQESQTHRLAQGWANEAPVLVFLTRDGRPPTTAGGREADWKVVSWAQLADLLEEAIADSPRCAPGAREYLETLRWYGGTGA